MIGSRTTLLLAVGTLLSLALGACGASSSGRSTAGAPAPSAAPTTAAPAVQVPIAGRNLIVNGDAEAAPGTDGTTIAPDVPGWTRTGDFTAVAYDTASTGNFPTPTDPGPQDRGKNFFAGGPHADHSSAVQTIDVSDAGPAIDGGRVSYTFSAWLGGYRGQDDQVLLTAQFLGSDGSVLATSQLPVVLDRDRGGRTGLLLRTVSGTMTAGTRRVKIDMEMIRKAGTANDGYADDLSLVLNTAA